MGPEGWLSIADYAGKYRVSISTLRRRIKAGDIEFNFREGKYLIKDQPLMQNGSHSLTSPVAPPHKGEGMKMSEIMSADGEEEPTPVLATANRLLNELKKAYSLILQEKEEQILLLKDEVADLRTLVKVLESENERLRRSGELTWAD